MLTDLLAAVYQWCRAGERRCSVTPAIDVLLDEDNVYGPDLLWYSG